MPKLLFVHMDRGTGLSAGCSKALSLADDPACPGEARPSPHRLGKASVGGRTQARAVFSMAPGVLRSMLGSAPNAQACSLAQDKTSDAICLQCSMSCCLVCACHTFPLQHRPSHSQPFGRSKAFESKCDRGEQWLLLPLSQLRL